MDKRYIRASQRYGWNDNETMRKRWKTFQEHQKKCKQRNRQLHELYMKDRNQWEAELSKTPAEQNRQRSLEAQKAKLLARLKKR